MKWFSHKTLPLYALALLCLTFVLAYGLSQPGELALRVPDAVPSTVAADAAAQTESAASSEPTAGGDFFREFRAQRQTARADELALLDSILQREGAPADSIREADARRVQLTRFYEQERAIEKLLIAKGFEDAAAFIQEGSVSIIVKKEKLTISESDKILEIALRESGQDASCIKIIPVVQP